MYFKARNGTFKRVPTYANENPMGVNDGMTVYYIPPYDGVTKVKAFAPVSTYLADPVGLRIFVLRGDCQGLPYDSWQSG